MSTHALTTDAFRGTITTRHHISGDEVLCVVDLAPRTLGLLSLAHASTMLRGTVTYTSTAAGQCMAVEHTVRAASGETVPSATLFALTEALMPFAKRELRDVAVTSRPAEAVKAVAGGRGDGMSAESTTHRIGRQLRLVRT